MLGYDIDSFWDQTPRTLGLAFDAGNEKLRIEHNERAWLAWHTAALHRVKRPPALSKLQVARPVSGRPQWQDQLEGLKRWVEQTGGKVIYNG